MYFLNRTQLIVAGIGIIFIFFLLNRLNFMHKSAVAAGKVCLVEIKPTPDEKVITYIVVFKVGKRSYLFIPEHDYGLESDSIVPVIYKQAQPSVAKVFTFSGFWYRGLLACILPIMVWSAFGLSYIKRRSKIRLNVNSLIPSEIFPILKQITGKSYGDEQGLH